MHIFHLSLPFQDHEDPFGLEWIGTLYDDKKYMLSLISATKYDHHRPSLRQGEAPSRRETIERPSTTTTDLAFVKGKPLVEEKR